jgi:hypothetical protein
VKYHKNNREKPRPRTTLSPTDRFFITSGVHLSESTSGGFFHFHRADFSSMIKSRVSLILAKVVALGYVRGRG